MGQQQSTGADGRPREFGPPGGNTHHHQQQQRPPVIPVPPREPEPIILESSLALHTADGTKKKSKKVKANSATTTTPVAVVPATVVHPGLTLASVVVARPSPSSSTSSASASSAVVGSSGYSASGPSTAAMDAYLTAVLAREDETDKPQRKQIQQLRESLRLIQAEAQRMRDMRGVLARIQHEEYLRNASADGEIDVDVNIETIEANFIGDNANKRQRNDCTTTTTPTTSTTQPTYEQPPATPQQATMTTIDNAMMTPTNHEDHIRSASPPQPYQPQSNFNPDMFLVDANPISLLDDANLSSSSSLAGSDSDGFGSGIASAPGSDSSSSSDAFHTFQSMDFLPILSTKLADGAINEQVVGQHLNLLSQTLPPNEEEALVQELEAMELGCKTGLMLVRQRVQAERRGQLSAQQQQADRCAINTPVSGTSAASDIPSSSGVGRPRFVPPADLSPDHAADDDLDQVARIRLTMIFATPPRLTTDNHPDAMSRKRRARENQTRPPADDTVASGAPPGRPKIESPAVLSTAWQVNQRFERLLGVSQREVTDVLKSNGQRAAYTFVRPDHEKACHRIMQRWRIQGINEGHLYQVRVTPSGREIYCLEHTRIDVRGVFFHAVQSIMPMPDDAPVPPYKEGVDLDEATLLFGYHPDEN